MKVIKFLDKSIDNALTLFFLLVLLVGCWFIYDSIYVFNNTSSKVAAYKINSSKDLKEFKELSKDCIAWITINDTKLDFPIMQGDDNSEYLNKDPYGEYSLAGSIFMDSRNSADFSDEYTLIYGHHMSGDNMFGVIDNFFKTNYFNEHRNGVIITENKTYKIKTFALLSTDANEDIIFNPSASTVDDLKLLIKNEASIYYSPEGEKIVALSTCKSPLTTERTILFVSIIGEVH